MRCLNRMGDWTLKSLPATSADTAKGMRERDALVDDVEEVRDLTSKGRSL